MGRITEEDRIVIKVLNQEKGYGARKIVKEFPTKNWCLGSVSRVLKRIRQTGSHHRKKSTGRKRSARTKSNINKIEQLIGSPDGQPLNKLSSRKLAQITGLSRTTIRRIVVQDIPLKAQKVTPAKKLSELKQNKRLELSKSLLQRFKTKDISKIWFTAEKTFPLIQPGNTQCDKCASCGSTNNDTTSADSSTTINDTPKVAGCSTHSSTPSVTGGSTNNYTQTVARGCTNNYTPSAVSGSTNNYNPYVVIGSAHIYNPGVVSGSTNNYTPSEVGAYTNMYTPRVVYGSTNNYTQNIVGDCTNYSSCAVSGANDIRYAEVCQNDNPEPKPLCEKSSDSVTVSLGASCSGKTSVIFIDKGLKLTARDYCDDVLSRLIPEIEGFNSVYVFQQDGTPSHRAKQTVSYLQARCPDFIKPSDWPPDSPDLNPIHYFVWGQLMKKVYTKRTIRDVQHLKECIVKAWSEISQKSIKAAILQWRKRLEKLMEKNGGHIEQFL